MTTCFNKLFVDAFALQLLFKKSRRLFLFISTLQKQNIVGICCTPLHISKQDPSVAYMQRVCMGVGRIFSRGGALRDFSKVFPGRGQKWWNLIFAPRNWKNNLFCWNFQNQGDQSPLSPLPTPMRVSMHVLRGVVLKKRCGNAVPMPNKKEDCTT